MSSLILLIIITSIIKDLIPETILNIKIKPDIPTLLIPLPNITPALISPSSVLLFNILIILLLNLMNLSLRLVNSFLRLIIPPIGLINFSIKLLVSFRPEKSFYKFKRQNKELPYTDEEIRFRYTPIGRIG